MSDSGRRVAGWARPEVLVLMDFDIYITWLHKAYRVAFEEAKTPDAMIALWQEKNAGLNPEETKTFKAPE